jgi:Fe-Mn family superoxide dismutase
MKNFEEQKFNIPELQGISKKNIEEHLKLYSGYVKFSNLIMEKITELAADADKNAYMMGELHRRFGFEFNGMRNHEYYFKSLEGGAKALPEDSELMMAIKKDAPTFDLWLIGLKSLAMTRGVGWAIVYYDKETEQMVYAWVDEQHLGQLNGLHFILGIDMWEHAYVYDYATSEKKKYVDAFLENLNWEVIESNFLKATS